MISTKQRARGRWGQILPALGIGADFLTGRNGPCPICGGKDRFRFIDLKPADGMWLCNQCQPKPRPAIDLAIAFTGRPFLETARLIDDILGDRRVMSQNPTPIRPSDAIKGPSAYALKVWRRGVRIRPGDVADQYLRSRGVGMDIYPPCLRFSPLDWHRVDATDVTTRHPAMFAAITNPAGKHIATHRTFLSPDGVGKADVATPRKVAGPFGKGPTIRLMPPAPIMGIAEGIETALSAARLFGVPVWSVICAHGIETFEPPPECRQLIVFADHDRHGCGQRAAETLRAKLLLPTEIRIPDRIGDDWNDVLHLEVSR